MYYKFIIELRNLTVRVKTSFNWEKFCKQAKN